MLAVAAAAARMVHVHDVLADPPGQRVLGEYEFGCRAALPDLSGRNGTEVKVHEQLRAEANWAIARASS